jgi:nitrate reductase gamma subunit
VVATLLLIWVWLAVASFVGGCAIRALKYMRAPIHLRWDLYPVAHEPRRDHGGSYLEEKDWWTKPLRKSLLGEIVTMAEEIVVLKGVWDNNRRLWWGSMPFHWGLYLLVVTTVGLVPLALGLHLGWLVSVLGVLAVAGGALLTVGAVVLLATRSTSARLKPYTTPLDRLNLAVFAAFGALCVVVAASAQGMAPVVEGLGMMARMRPADATPILLVQMAVGGLIILYLPFTRMIHFFSKYFLYHEVRWDDAPVKAGSAMEARLRAALNFGVDWRAEHVRTGRTWAEVATTLPSDKQGGK